METGPDAATCRNTETESFDGPILGLTAPGELTEEQTDAFFMRAALKLAAEAAAEGEVPVGALIVHNGSVITGGSLEKTPCPTRSLRRSTQPAVRSAAGACRGVRST